MIINEEAEDDESKSNYHNGPEAVVQLIEALLDRVEQ
jgi:hypothetical protein